MLKKIVLGVLITAAVGSLLLVGQIKVATWLYDSKMDSVLSKAERKVPGLQLDYVPKESSFTGRSGRIYITVPLKKGNVLGEAFLTAAADIKVLFGPLRVSGSFVSVPDEGNISDILSKFNVDPLTLHGAFKVRAITPKVELAVKTDSFLLPVSTGICKMGQNALLFSATSADDPDLRLKSAGIICEGAERYDGRASYRLDLLGLNVNFLPRIIDRKPHFDRLEISADRLDFRFSALYALGFSPEDNVKDPSLQEAVSFENVSTLVSMSDPDREGMAKLSFDNKGTYGFAFPYVKNNTEQPFSRYENFRLAGSVERISLSKLLDAVKGVLEGADEHFDANKVMKSIMSAFSDETVFALDALGFNKDGGRLDIKGSTVFSFDDTSARPKLRRFDSEYSLESDRALLESLAAPNYTEPLRNAVNTGLIIDDGMKYRTEFVMAGKKLSMNGITLSDLSDNEDEKLYYEEQKALQREREAELKEKQALEEEIRAAREAQSNLPALSEGQDNDLSEEEAAADSEPAGY